MRICRVTPFLVVFEKFGTVLRVLKLFCLFWKLNFQAVIKSAASSRLESLASFKCVATAPKLISGPCSIEKYPSSQMANRYTRIFDAG